MALNCGIVGLPNVGKSTIFSALTANNVEAETTRFVQLSQIQELLMFLMNV